MKKTIRITAKRILDGERCSPGNCAVALAIQPHVRPDVRVWVGPSEITFKRGAECSDIPVAERIGDFITVFDLSPNSKPDPFTFTLDIPKQYLRQ